jgi:hypothetical protein
MCGTHGTHRSCHTRDFEESKICYRHRKHVHEFLFCFFPLKMGNARLPYSSLGLSSLVCVGSCDWFCDLILTRGVRDMITGSLGSSLELKVSSAEEQPEGLGLSLMSVDATAFIY